MKLAGIAEIAALLDESRQRVNQLVDNSEKNGFPEPIDRIAAGPVWKHSDVEKWKKQWKAQTPA
ncbi:MAG TPA: hypothetical protein VMF31_00625 [Solirubrobacterales bacterium]|nr:hypothetical protein [Solirubrobacterales bacterium]